MAAVASLRIKASPLKARSDHLVAKGKPPKLARTALMRKILVTRKRHAQSQADVEEPL